MAAVAVSARVMRQALLFVVVLLWVGAVLLWRGDDPTELKPREGAREKRTEVGLGGADTKPRVEKPPRRRPVMGEDEKEDEAEIKVKGVPVVIRGRCVDEKKVPIAGCRVRLDGHEPQVITTRGRPLPNSTWRDPSPALTRGDGRFEFHVSMNPDRVFDLEITAAGCVGRSTLDGLKLEGKRFLDLGDVELVRGCIASGRVVDDRGRPQVGVGVKLVETRRSRVYRYLWLKDAGESFNNEYRTRATTDARGRFTMPDPLPEGNWELQVEQRVLVWPKRLVVEPDVRRMDLALCVRDDSKVLRITGRVLDEAGRPIRGAVVGYYWGDPPHVSGLSDRKTFSGRDGSFTLRRLQKTPDVALSLLVDRAGYQQQQVDGLHWGVSKVVVRLARAPGVHVQVRDRDTHRPVEFFSYHVEPTFENKDAEAYHSSLTIAHRKRGDLFLRLDRGPHVVVVAPLNFGYANNRYLISVPQRFTVQKGETHLVTVELTRPSRREVIVRHHSGEPVAGTHLQLAQRAGSRPVDVRSTMQWPIGGERSKQGRGAWLLDETRTDEAGCAELVGDPREEYSLRVMGPGHAPFVLHGVRVDPQAGSLRIQVPRSSPSEDR